MGRATALAFARYGALGLVVADINQAGVEETAKQAKQEATNPDFTVYASYVDVRDFTSVQKVFNEAITRFKRVDYSVTTAGVRIQKHTLYLRCVGLAP